MAGIYNNAYNLAVSIYTIPQRTSQVGYIRSASNAISSLKQSATEQVTCGAMYGVRALSLHSFGGMPIARTCARKFYDQTGAKSLVSAAASSTLKAVTSSDFVKRNLGETASGLLYELGALAGQTAEEIALEECAARVFHPLISLLREKIIENRVRGCVDVAIDTGVLWAAGGLNVVGHLNKAKQVATVASKIATCVNLGALAYVYGTPVVNCGKAVLQCRSLKSRMTKINKSLNYISLEPLLKRAHVNISEQAAKKALSTMLAIVLENGGLSSTIDLDILFADEKLLSAMVNIVAAAFSLQK